MNIISDNWAKNLNAHIPWILMMLLITIQSGLSSDLLSLKMPRGLDKLIHFFIFGILGWVMTRGFIITENKFIKKHYKWLIPLIAGSFALLDEYHQAIVPGRFPDPLDWLADFLGVVFFMWLYQKRNPGYN